MENLLIDLRLGFRMLIRRPGLSAAAIIALAWAIGANSAIFSTVEAVLLRPLPYVEPNRLVLIESIKEQDAGKSALVSYPDFEDMRNQGEVFDQMAAIESRGLTLTGSGEPERLEGAAVSYNLFPLLGVDPILGRSFAPEEDQPGVGVAVLSYGLWQRRFGGDQSVIGQAITLEGASRTVIGVLPRDFSFPIGIEKAEVYTPVTFDGLSIRRRGNRYLTVVGRLKTGNTVAEAQAELTTIASRLERDHANTNAGRTVRVTPLYEALVGAIRPALLIIWGAVALVLLIALSNVAHLVLAGSESRMKEISIRTAVGASRWRIVRQMLAEGVALGLAGGAAGLLLATLGVKLLVSFGPGNIPRLNELGISGWVFLFNFTLALGVGLILGLVPAFVASRADLYEALRERDRTTAKFFGQYRLSSLLVVSEVALVMLLIIGAGLLVRSFVNLYQVKPGFDSSNVLTMKIILPYSKFKTANTFVKTAIERIEELPEVEAAGGVTQLPLSGDKLGTTFTIEGQPAPAKGSEPRAELRAITPHYFKAMHIPLERGREFNEGDKEDSPGVMIINSAMARAYWPDENPIGKRVSLALKLYDTEPAVREIVGVVGDIRHLSLTEPPVPEMYVPHLQQNWPFMSFAVRTRTEPLATLGRIRGQVFLVDGDQPVSNVKTLESLVGDSIARPRFYMLLLGIFASLALVLAIVGIYGLLAYSVTQRTHEIGVRVAIGAQSKDILRLIIAQGLKLSGIGIAIGLAGAIALTRVMSNLLFGVSTIDPLTFVIVPVVLAGVAMLASYIPARRATLIDPIIALREE